MYFDADDVAVAGRKAIMGALTLYLDFINLFTFFCSSSGTATTKDKRPRYRDTKGGRLAAFLFDLVLVDLILAPPRHR